MLTCRHRLEGGQNSPPIYCDRPVKRMVKATGSSELDGMLVCGVHGNFWKARGFRVLPIEDIR